MGTLQANRTAVQDWEKFTVLKVGAPNGSGIKDGDRVCLKTHHNKWLSALNGGGALVNAGADRCDKWETFNISFTN